MKVILRNTSLVFQEHEEQEVEVTAGSKEGGMYKVDGTTDTTFQPENYQHQGFSFSALSSTGIAKVSCTNARVSNNYAAIVVFVGDTVASAITIGETGKTYTDFEVELPVGASKIGVTLGASDTASVRVWV